MSSWIEPLVRCKKKEFWRLLSIFGFVQFSSLIWSYQRTNFQHSMKTDTLIDSFFSKLLHYHVKQIGLYSIEGKFVLCIYCIYLEERWQLSLHIWKTIWYRILVVCILLRTLYATEANMLYELCCVRFHISPWVRIYFLIDRFTHASAQKSTTKYTFAKIDSQYFSQLGCIWNCGKRTVL